MHQEHGVTLLESDMIEIRNIVLEAIKDEEEQAVETKKQALDFWYKYGHLPKGVKIHLTSLSQYLQDHNDEIVPKNEVDPCESSKGWFESYLKDYVKSAPMTDLFDKLRNVTKPEHHPLVEEIHSRYGDKIIDFITLKDEFETLKESARKADKKHNNRK